MAFLNKETGELTFADGLRLSPGLALGELSERLGGRTDAVVRLEIADPCPDAPLCVRCPFGELFLSADPYTGRAEARVLYAACSNEGGTHVPFTDPE